MPTYVERGIAALPYLYVNGGRRGYLVGMVPADLHPRSATDTGRYRDRLDSIIRPIPLPATETSPSLSAVAMSLQFFSD